MTALRRKSVWHEIEWMASGKGTGRSATPIGIGQNPLAEPKIHLGCQLDVSRFSIDQTDSAARLFNELCIIRSTESGLGCAKVGITQEGPMEPLGGLAAVQVGAVSDSGPYPVRSADGIVKGKHGHDRRGRIQGIEHADDQARGAEGPGTVVNQYPIGRIRRQGIEAVGHGILSFRSARNERSQLAPAGAIREYPV